MAQTPSVKRYHGLRLMSMIYKMLAILTVIFSLVGVSYVLISYFAVTPQPRVGSWVIPALAYLIGGGLASFTFYALAQIVDVQVDTHDRINQLVGYMESQGASNQQILTGLRLLINQNREPARTDGKIPVQLEERKERLRSNEDKV